jgi:hypothetical protein
MLLEFMSRGAFYLGNNNVIVNGDGRCTVHSPYVSFKERNIARFPELQDRIFESTDEDRESQKRLSFHRMALSMKGRNPATRLVKENLMSRFNFTHYADVNRLFPDRKKVIDAPIAHAFYLERMAGDPLVIDSSPKELAQIVANSEWIFPDNGGYSHNTLAEMAGLDRCVKEDYARVFEDLFSHAECHRVRIPHPSSRSLISKIVDEIDPTIS